MLRTRVIAQLAALALALAATPAVAKTISESRSGPWTIAAIADDRTGAFVQCSGRTEANDGVGLVLSQGARAQWSLGFTGNLGGSPGVAYPVRYRIDRGATRSGVASVVQPNFVQIALDEPGAFLEELRRGGTLTADAGAERLTFSLRDTRAMLSQLAACAERQTNKPTQTASVTPAAGGESALLRPLGSQPDAERRLEAMTVAVNILSRAKVTGFELQPSQIPAQLTGHDVVWQSGDVGGSLRIVSLQSGASLSTVRADLVAMDIKACEGRFTAEANSGPDGASAALLTVCQGEKGRAADYLAMPRSAGGAYVLSLMGPPDKTEAVKAAASSLWEPAVQVGTRTR